MLLRLAAAPRLSVLKHPAFAYRKQLRNASTELGLRRASPPDSSSGPEHTPPQKVNYPTRSGIYGQVRRLHWLAAIKHADTTFRTGRAINIIQQTLPEFFKTGLITSIDEETGRLTSSSVHSEQAAYLQPKDTAVIHSTGAAAFAFSTNSPYRRFVVVHSSIVYTNSF